MTQGDCFERIERAFKAAATALQEARVDFMLGGSLAAWVRGGPESCNDLDLIIRPGDADRALQALGDAGMRTERPPEGWLVKAWHEDILIDVICEPMGIEIDDAAFTRAEGVTAWGVPVLAMSLEDVLVSKLLAMHEHYLDFAPALELARVLREQIDWQHVRARTDDSPYARAFFTLVEELGIVPRAPHAERAEHPGIRVATIGSRRGRGLSSGGRSSAAGRGGS
jgi:Uncharacterised nucleotidyltransferase